VSQSQFSKGDESGLALGSMSKDSVGCRHLSIWRVSLKKPYSLFRYRRVAFYDFPDCIYERMSLGEEFASSSVVYSLLLSYLLIIFDKY
jgi:hypothetical protein